MWLRMWRLNCGCGEAPSPFEFQINDKPIIVSNIDFTLPNETDRQTCLMEKIIQDYFNIINKLECGIQPELENILEEISLIEMKKNWNFSVAKKVFTSDDDDEEDYLRRSKYLSEFESEEEKDEAVKNLGLDGTRHIILSKLEFENLGGQYIKDAIYFVTD